MIINIWKSFQLKMMIILLFVVASLAISIYFIFYNQYYNLTINKLKDDAIIIHKYAEEVIDENIFLELDTIEDEVKEIYITAHQQLDEIRRIANIRYLYTAKRNEKNEYIYIVDGLDKDAEDFRNIGNFIEGEIVNQLKQCLDDEVVLGSKILETEWGIVYVTYFPFHDEDGNVLGAIGMEFDCEYLYNSLKHVRLITVIISFFIAFIFIIIASFITVKVVKNTESVLESMEISLTNAEKESAMLSEFHHAALSSAPIGLVVFDDECNLIDCNKAALEMLGVTKFQYLNDPSASTPEFQSDGSKSIEKAHDNMRRVINGETIKTEWIHQSQNGEPIPCELTFIRIKRKERYFGFGYFYDLRHIKKFEAALAEAEERIKLMLDASPLSCQLWNHNLELIDCNEAAALPFGFNNKQEYIDRFAELSPEYQSDGQRSRDSVIIHLRKTFMEGKCVIDWMHQMPDGTPIPSEVTLVRVRYRDSYAVAGYIKDLRVLKKLEKKAIEAYYDPLTGIYNRRYFEENMVQLLKILSRSGGILSLMMIDIDHFKKYNDTYGHSEGDNCLKITADILSKNITRDTDYAVRFGGEEFVIVLPNADRDGACMIAEKIINNVRERGIPHEKNDAAPYVTVSIGVTTGIVNHTQTNNDYVKKADEMMYLSKRSGRDRYNFSHL
jgi:diguanylate cyclase (GGDEF)-like protein/PAS domain S-box-containing protein